ISLSSSLTFSSPLPLTFQLLHSCLLPTSLLSFFFFFLMLRPPPTSPLFPYTTLFRSGDAASSSTILVSEIRPVRTPKWCTSRRRSEEHTSELQSLTNLVCRLLLEKKKKKKRAEILEATQ